MAAYANNPFGNSAMAAALREKPLSGQSPVSYPQGPHVGRQQANSVTFQPGAGVSTQRNDESQSSVSPQTANNLAKYVQNLRYGGGATQAAGQSAMPAMSAGGGSDLGAMGLQQGSVNFPGAAAAYEGGGSFGSAAGSSLAEPASISGAGGGGAGASAMSNAFPAAAAVLASYFIDQEMNENKGSAINADKINSYGTIGDSGIGLRFGDLANGINPATWLSDPKKGANGLANFFTGGLWDKAFG